MTAPALRERIEAIARRMDVGYAERRKHHPRTAGYAAADEAIEAAYADLRALNVELGAFASHSAS